MEIPFWAINFIRSWFHLLCRLLFRIEFRGEEHIPLGGPLIIAPNHVTYLDPFFVSIPIRRRIYYMTWDKVFEVPVLSTVARLLGSFPVQLDSADKSAVTEAKRKLEGGHAVMIFPEGGRSEDGRLQPFRSGAFRLAITTGSSLLPVTLSGAFAVWPRQRLLPRTGHIRIVYHPAVHPPVAPPTRPEDIRREARRLADEVRIRITSALESADEGP